jgi:hypothetical protein
MGATRANDFSARRTSADKPQMIIPGREPIRTALNALQVSTDLMLTTDLRPALAGPCDRCWLQAASV